jgi:hypothetical protein
MTGGEGDLGPALTAQFVRYPERILQLVKSYAPGLPWAQIEEEVTEEQIQIAYGRILEVAFPYLAHLAAERAALLAK